MPDSLARACDSFGPHTQSTHSTVNPENDRFELAQQGALGVVAHRVGHPEDVRHRGVGADVDSERLHALAGFALGAGD